MAHIKRFDEVQRRENALNRRPPRLQPVEVAKIVGTVDEAKADALTPDFLPRAGGANSSRYRSVYSAMRIDTPLPPIEVYALRDEFYLVDGHHRVAAARALDFLYLDAQVHEFMLPDTTDANRLHNGRRHFEQLTGIEDIELTESGQYEKLLSQIREHRFFLGNSGRVVGLIEAAEEWREYVYTPITTWLALSGVPGHFPGRTVADLYIYVCDYKWVKSQNKGMDIGFPKALSDFNQLYPPPSGPAAALAALRRTLHTLTAPVRNAATLTTIIW